MRSGENHAVGHWRKASCDRVALSSLNSTKLGRGYAPGDASISQVLIAECLSIIHWLERLYILAPQDWAGRGFFKYANNFSLTATRLPLYFVPTVSPSRGGDVAVFVHSFLFCSGVCFCLYGPFNCISFHKFSPTTLRFLTLVFRSFCCCCCFLHYWSFQLRIS